MFVVRTRLNDNLDRLEEHRVKHDSVYGTLPEYLIRRTSGTLTAGESESWSQEVRQVRQTLNQ